MSFNEDTYSQSSATSSRLNQFTKFPSAKSHVTRNSTLDRYQRTELDDRFKLRQRSGSGALKPRVSQSPLRQTRLTLNGMPPDFGSAETSLTGDAQQRVRANFSPNRNSSQFKDVSAQQSNFQNRNAFPFSRRRVGRKSEPTPTAETESQIQGLSERSNKSGVRPGLSHARKPSKQLSPLSEGHQPNASGVTFEGSASWTVNDMLQNERSPSKKLQRILQSELDLAPATTTNTKESPENSLHRLLDPECSSLDCGNPRYTTPEKYCTLCRSEKSLPDLTKPTDFTESSQLKPARRESDDLLLKGSGERRVSFTLEQSQPTLNLNQPMNGTARLSHSSENPPKTRCNPLSKRVEGMFDKWKRSGFTSGRFSPTSATTSSTKNDEDRAAFSDEDRDTLFNRARARFKPMDFDCWKSLKEHAPRCVSPTQNKTKRDPKQPEDLSEKSLPAVVGGNRLSHLSDQTAAKKSIWSEPESQKPKETGNESGRGSPRGKTSPVYFLHFLPRGPFFNRKGRTGQGKGSLPADGKSIEDSTMVKQQQHEQYPQLMANSLLDQTIQDQIERLHSSQTDQGIAWTLDKRFSSEDPGAYRTPPSADTGNSVLEGTVTLAKQSVSQPVVEDRKIQTMGNAQMIFRPSVSGPESPQPLAPTETNTELEEDHEPPKQKPSGKHRLDSHKNYSLHRPADQPDPSTLDDWLNEWATETRPSRNRISKDANFSKDMEQLNKSLADIRAELRGKRLSHNIDRVVDKLRRNALQLIELEQAFRLSRLQNASKKRNKSGITKQKEDGPVVVADGARNMPSFQNQILKAVEQQEKNLKKQDDREEAMYYDKFSNGTDEMEELLELLPLDDQVLPKQRLSGGRLSDKNNKLNRNIMELKTNTTNATMQQPTDALLSDLTSPDHKENQRATTEIDSNKDRRDSASKARATGILSKEWGLVFQNPDRIVALLGPPAPLTSDSRTKSHTAYEKHLINLLRSQGTRRHSVAEIPPNDLFNHMSMDLNRFTTNRTVTDSDSLERKREREKFTGDTPSALLSNKKRSSTVLSEAKVIPCSCSCPCGAAAAKRVQTKHQQQFTPIEQNEPVVNEFVAIVPAKSSEGFRTDSLTDVADQQIIPREVQSDDDEVLPNKRSAQSKKTELIPVKDEQTDATKYDVPATVQPLCANESRNEPNMKAKSDTNTPPDDVFASKQLSAERENIEFKPVSLIPADPTDCASHFSPSRSGHPKDSHTRDNELSPAVYCEEVEPEMKCTQQRNTRSTAPSIKSSGIFSPRSITVPPIVPCSETQVNQDCQRANARAQAVPLPTRNFRTEYSEELNDLGIDPVQHELPSITKSGNDRAKQSYLNKDSTVKPEENIDQLLTATNSSLRTEDDMASISPRFPMTSLRRSNNDPGAKILETVEGSLNDNKLILQSAGSTILKEDNIPSTSHRFNQCHDSRDESLQVQCGSFVQSDSVTPNSGAEMNFEATPRISQTDLSLPSHQRTSDLATPYPKPSSNDILPFFASEKEAGSLQLTKKDGEQKRSVGSIVIQSAAAHKVSGVSVSTSAHENKFTEKLPASMKDISMNEQDISVVHGGGQLAESDGAIDLEVVAEPEFRTIPTKFTGNETMKLPKTSVKVHSDSVYPTSGSEKQQEAQPYDFAQDFTVRGQRTPEMARSPHQSGLIENSGTAVKGLASNSQYYSDIQAGTIMHIENPSQPMPECNPCIFDEVKTTVNQLQSTDYPSGSSKQIVDLIGSYSAIDPAVAELTPAKPVVLCDHEANTKDNIPTSADDRSIANLLVAESVPDKRKSMQHISSLTAPTPQPTTSLHTLMRKSLMRNQLQLPDSLLVHIPQSGAFYTSELPELPPTPATMKGRREAKRDSLARTEDDVASFLLLGSTTSLPNLETDFPIDSGNYCLTTQLDLTIPLRTTLRSISGLGSLCRTDHLIPEILPNNFEHENNEENDEDAIKSRETRDASVAPERDRIPSNLGLDSPIQPSVHSKDQPNQVELDFPRMLAEASGHQLRVATKTMPTKSNEMVRIPTGNTPATVGSKIPDNYAVDFKSSQPLVTHATSSTNQKELQSNPMPSGTDKVPRSLTSNFLQIPDSPVPNSMCTNQRGKRTPRLDAQPFQKDNAIAIPNAIAEFPKKYAVSEDIPVSRHSQIAFPSDSQGFMTLTKCLGKPTVEPSTEKQNLSTSLGDFQAACSDQMIASVRSDLIKQTKSDTFRPMVKNTISSVSQITPPEAVNEGTLRKSSRKVADNLALTADPAASTRSKRTSASATRDSKHRMFLGTPLSEPESAPQLLDETPVIAATDRRLSSVMHANLQVRQGAPADDILGLDERANVGRSLQPTVASNYVDIESMGNPTANLFGVVAVSNEPFCEQAPDPLYDAISENRDLNREHKILRKGVSKPDTSRTTRLGELNNTGKRKSSASNRKKQMKQVSPKMIPHYNITNMEPPHPIAEASVDPSKSRKQHHRHSRASYERQVESQTRLDSLQSRISDRTVEKNGLQPTVVYSSHSSDLLDKDLQTMVTGEPKPREDSRGTIYASHEPVYPEDASTRFDEVKRKNKVKQSKSENELAEPKSRRLSGTSSGGGGGGGGGGSGGGGGGGKGTRASQTRKYRSTAQKSILLTAMVSERVNSQLSSRSLDSPEQESLASTSSATILRSFAQHAPHERSLDSRLDGDLLECDQITDLRTHLQHEPVLQPARPIQATSAGGRLASSKHQVTSLTINMPRSMGLREKPAGDLYEPHEPSSQHKIMLSVENSSRLLTISQLSLDKQMNDRTLGVSRPIDAEPTQSLIDLNQITLELNDPSKPSIVIHETCSESNEQRTTYTEVVSQLGDKHLVNRGAQTQDTTTGKWPQPNQDKSAKPRVRNAKAQAIMSNGTSVQLALEYVVKKITKEHRGKLPTTALSPVSQRKTTSLSWSPGVGSDKSPRSSHSNATREISTSQPNESRRLDTAHEVSKSSSSAQHVSSSSGTSQGDKSDEISLSICITDPSDRNSSRSSSSTTKGSSRTQSLDRGLRRTVRSCTAGLEAGRHLDRQSHRRYRQQTDASRTSRRIRREMEKSSNSGSLFSSSLSTDDIEEDQEDAAIDWPCSTRQEKRRCRSQNLGSPELDESCSLAPNILRLFRLSSSLKDLSVHLIYRELKAILLHRLMLKHCSMTEELPDPDCHTCHD